MGLDSHIILDHAETRALGRCLKQADLNFSAVRRKSTTKKSRSRTAHALCLKNVSTRDVTVDFAIGHWIARMTYVAAMFAEACLKMKRIFPTSCALIIVEGVRA